MPSAASVKLVADTNVLISGLLWHGSPHQLIELAGGGSLTLVSSPVLLAELAGALTKGKFADALSRGEGSLEVVLGRIQDLIEVTSSFPLAEPVCRDPDDDDVLACAVSAGADLIVSGDKDLLALGTYQGIAIVTPAEALNRIQTAAE